VIVESWRGELLAKTHWRQVTVGLHFGHVQAAMLRKQESAEE